jgi:Ca2+-binding RTX toxin-like protein
VIGSDYETVIGGAAATNITIQNIGLATDTDILAGTGSLTVNDQGQQDTIGSFGASPTNVTLGGPDNLLFASSGTTDVSVSGSVDTVIGSSGPLTVNASSAAILFGGSGPLSFVGGSAASTIAGGANETSAVTVGSGGVVFFAGSGSTTSIDGAAGASATTLFGGSSSSMFFTGSSGGLLFTAGAGNETLNASTSSADNTYGAGVGATQNVTVIGGSGDDTFFAGAGTDSFVGGANADTFAFFESVTSANANGGANDTITGWTTSDSLYLSGYNSSLTATTVFNSGTVASGSLTITLSDNTTITFENVSSTTEFNGRVLYS